MLVTALSVLRNSGAAWWIPWLRWCWIDLFQALPWCRIIHPKLFYSRCFWCFMNRNCSYSILNYRNCMCCISLTRNCSFRNVSYLTYYIQHCFICCPSDSTAWLTVWKYKAVSSSCPFSGHLRPFLGNTVYRSSRKLFSLYRDPELSLRADSAFTGLYII